MKGGWSPEEFTQLQYRSITRLIGLVSTRLARKLCRQISQRRLTLSLDVNHISQMRSTPLRMKEADWGGRGEVGVMEGDGRGLLSGTADSLSG